ncbi:COMM domain-containing protein 7 isoform X2 [Melanerpes formicivorus]|uniref:COMM domain-containing protein 7 isoform X2 n=1 Tax=Melanerpes formicivorus TaxID=211600 RepID=UPI00358F2EBB
MHPEQPRNRDRCGFQSPQPQGKTPLGPQAPVPGSLPGLSPLQEGGRALPHAPWHSPTPGQQFSDLTEVLFRFLTEPKEVERFLTQLSDFATVNKISLGPLKSIVKSILLVPSGALKRNLSPEQVRADFIALGLSEEKASAFAQQWKVNSPTLTRLAVGQTLMINQLIDMEWKFGVTAGSSELEKVGSIFLQFYSFLHEMERVKASLESFS